MTPSSTDETLQADIRFNAEGLIPVIVQDVISKDVLMLAYMNALALEKTIETKQAHYWSRSRQKLWHKGLTSGNIQYIKEIRTDCDQDSLLILIEQTGTGSCHTGRPHCFYRLLQTLKTLAFTEK